MPGVEVDGDAVDVRDAAALGRVALLDLLELERDVCDGRVDLAGDEYCSRNGRRISESFWPRFEISSSMSRNGTTPVSACVKSRK